MSDFLESWNKIANRHVVFAGVFDPVHIGHIETARRAAGPSGTVLFLPEKKPWHKHGQTDYEHRLNMLKIATEGHPNMKVLDSPYERHMIDTTFAWVKEQYPDKPLAFLVGSDVASYMHKWDGIERIKDVGIEQLIVSARDLDAAPSTHKRQLKPDHKSYQELRNILDIASEQSSHVYMSSSYIREDLHHRHTSLPQGVYDYIKQHNLYS